MQPVTSSVFALFAVLLFASCTSFPRSVLIAYRYASTCRYKPAISNNANVDAYAFLQLLCVELWYALVIVYNGAATAD